MTYKELITRLQLAPKIPPVIPAVPYPAEEGTHKGSKYYVTAITSSTVNDFLENYLDFLATCKAIAQEGRQDQDVKDLTLSITKDKKTTYDKAKAIHSWVYNNVKYERTTYIIPPWKLIKPDINGDCKSFAILIASMLGIVGIPCWFKLVEIPGFTALHMYDLGSLSWEVIDGTGAYAFKEVKPVSGYVLYEIDSTYDWPPKPLPQGEGEVTIPTEVSEAVSLIGKVALVSGIIGAIGLGIWSLTE